MHNIKIFLATVVWCLSLSWRTSKFYTVIRIAANILTPLLAIVVVYISRHLLNLLAGSVEVEDAARTLIMLFGGMFAIALLRMGSQKAAQYSQSMQGELINAEISLSMMERSLSADLEYFDNPSYYDRLQSASQDSMAVSHILWNVISCISASVAFVGAFSLLFQANPLYGVMMMGAAIPSSIAAARYTKLLYVLNLEQINEHRQMGYCSHLASEKAYAHEIRLFNAGDMLKTRYRRIWTSLFTKRKGTTRKRSILTGLLECLPEAAIVFIGINVALDVLNGVNTVGDYALFTGLAGQLWNSIYMFSSSSLQIYDNQLKIENIKKLDSFQNHVLDTGTKELPCVDTISFENVSFAYPHTTAMVLTDVTFTLHKNEKAMFVGLNGSGKSTLVKLLLRMYEPSKGVIRINGLDIKEYRLSELRANFSVYFQDMYNFKFSLRENFTIADGKTDEIHATAALKSAYGDDILEKAVKGMDTGITRLFDPEGIELSGGQHQKLALARTLFRRHTALVLDEPSSNLDPKAEHEIFNSLKKITQGKMTLFTSHRLSNVALADRILVLEKGLLVEDGTQEELLRNKHRYAELFNYQKEKYSG